MINTPKYESKGNSADEIINNNSVIQELSTRSRKFAELDQSYLKERTNYKENNNLNNSNINNENKVNP